MKASLVLHEKFIEEDGSIIEMKIWKFPKSIHYPLGVRYSLYWVKDGNIISGYDNHYPKGPHRHCENQEEEYHFVSVETLIEDFKNDLRRMKR